MGELLTVTGAAVRSHISRRTIHRWINEGVLPKVGNKVRIDDVADLIQSLILKPRRGPRPGRARYQVIFKNNGFPAPKAQKRLSDIERAARVTNQLALIRSPYVLDLLAKQAHLFGQLRTRDHALGAWTKAEDLLREIGVIPNPAP